MERSVLILRDFLYFSVKLGGGCLVNAAGVGQTALAYSLKYPEHSGGVHVCGELRRVEADLHVALGSEVIYFVRADLAHHLDEAHGVAHIGVMQMEIRTAFEMCDPLSVIY